MAKIAINMLYLNYEMNSGVGKHIENILDGLLQINRSDEFYLVMRSSFYEDHFAVSGIGKRIIIDSFVKVVECSEGRFLQGIFSRFGENKLFAQKLFLNHVVFPYFLYKNNIDLAFYPFNDASNTILKFYPAVVVIHDLFYKNYPLSKKGVCNCLKMLYIDLKHRMMLSRSSSIVVLSKYAKSEIIKYFPRLQRDKISIIPNAVAIRVGDEICVGISTPYILCVGEHGIHKNHLTLLKAFKLISERITQKLVLLGHEREKTADIKNYIAKNNLGNRVTLISNISDAERNWLYVNADLFISPSLHEGFGRTPIEAAMLGAMVLTSRETSLPEVTMELLNYYEPATDENALAAKILYLLANPTPLEERKKIAEAYKDLYDPVSIAGMYIDLFYKCLK